MKVKYENISGIAKVPRYSSTSAAGADLYAVSFAAPIGEKLGFIDWLRNLLGKPNTPGKWYLRPGRRVIASTGLRLEIPEGFEGQIRSRSGWAFHGGVVAFHGTIDSDYRGEVKVLLFNHGPKTVQLLAGERVAQIVVTPANQDQFEEGELSGTARGQGGFGSTGK
jgi:dUTP pyrophosphatase